MSKWWKKQHDVAEHFACFVYKGDHLQDDGSINIKELRNIFYTQYQPIYHYNNVGIGIVGLLLRYKLLHRLKKRQNEDGVVKFNMEMVRAASSTVTYKDNDGLPPPLDPSVTKPIVKLLVNQQHVFKTVAEKCDGFDHLECKYCQEKFSSDSQFQDHLLEETHKLRHLYRTNKKSLLNSQYKLTVCVNEDGKSLENVIVRPGTAGSARVNVANCSEEMKMLTDAIPLIIHSKVKVDCPHFPVEIKPGDTLHLSIVYCFEDSGAYMYPVLLKIQSQTSSEPVYVLKELVFRCQSELVDDLKPISEYKYPIPPKLRVSEGPIIPGVPPSSMKSSLVMVRRLDNYYIPPYLDKVLNNGLKQHPKMSSAEVKKLNEVKVLLGVDDVKEGLKARKCNLSANNYCDLFSLLLHIEEHQMKIDIHTFDCDNQILKAIPGEHNLLALKVPGLAENRPSVLRGDAIYIEILGDNNHLRYEGIVHRVRENDVHLGFHKNFITKYVMGMQLRVQFTFNRLPLRVQHRALSMLRRCEVQKLMFPSIYRGLFGVSPITKWFNRDVSTNQQQMTAVTNIVFESASPAPYIVFGPPGTGKTVTMVEAIVQLWHIKKPHMLVCAPSNSAADVIASRLLEKGHIPASNILRMYAASRLWEAVPLAVRCCANYDKASEDYYYPTLAEIMKYHVVIVTLVTSAKLVTSGIPAGHFSHVFIDEGGHAMEPEVLVPIAGILTTEGHRGTFTGQLVIAGDPKQLGPIIRSTVANKLGLGRSYLERLMDEVDLYSRDEETDAYDTAVITKLIKNFRSHKDILNISNSLFYHKELKVCGGPEITLACNWPELPKKGFPIIFHGIVGKDEREASSPSFFNVQEIDLVLSYVGKLLQDRLSGRKINQKEIGIVTPYRKQAQKFKQAMKKKNWQEVSVGSVEEFQGQERLIIIISTVRSSHELLEDDYKFRLGFLDNPKRFNVAMTRAKSLLIVVGNPNILQCDYYWHQLLKYCHKNNAYRGVKFPLHKKSPVDRLIKDMKQLDINTDVVNSKEEGPQWRGEL